MAALFAALAVLLAASAANSFPAFSSDPTVDEFQINNKQRAKKALCRLHWAMGCGVLAAAMTLVGAAFVLVSSKDATPKKPPLVVAVVHGTADCGEVRADNGGLKVAGVSLVDVSSVTVVTACPKP